MDDVRGAAQEGRPERPLGGQPAANKDFIDAVYGSFPLMIALISVITFVLLARAFRSLLLPPQYYKHHHNILLTRRRIVWGTPTDNFWCCHGTLIQAQSQYLNHIVYGGEEATWSSPNTSHANWNSTIMAAA